MGPLIPGKLSLKIKLAAPTSAVTRPKPVLRKSTSNLSKRSMVCRHSFHSSFRSGFGGNSSFRSAVGRNRGTDKGAGLAGGGGLSEGAVICALLLQISDHRQARSPYNGPPAAARQTQAGVGASSTQPPARFGRAQEAA